MEFVISPQEEGEDFQPQPQSIQFFFICIYPQACQKWEKMLKSMRPITFI